MKYNLLKLDAFANYEVLAEGKTKEECEQIIAKQPEDKKWHEYELIAMNGGK